MLPSLLQSQDKNTESNFLLTNGLETLSTQRWTEGSINKLLRGQIKTIYIFSKHILKSEKKYLVKISVFFTQLRRPRHPDGEQQVGRGLGHLPRQPEELHRG